MEETAKRAIIAAKVSLKIHGLLWAACVSADGAGATTMRKGMAAPRGILRHLIDGDQDIAVRCFQCLRKEGADFEYALMCAAMQHNHAGVL